MSSITVVSAPMQEPSGKYRPKTYLFDFDKVLIKQMVNNVMQKKTSSINTWLDSLYARSLARIIYVSLPNMTPDQRIVIVLRDITPAYPHEQVIRDVVNHYQGGAS